MHKIIQITDCHVSGAAGVDYRGADPRQSLLEMVERALAWGPELVLLTGDLAEDGSESAYAWLAEVFQQFAVPVLTTPGNHDDVEMQQRYFPHTSADRLQVIEADWRIVLLNSAVPGEVPGTIGAAQLAELTEVLQRKTLPTVLAMHHQPLLVGSPWIDRYPLLNAAELWGRLDESVKLLLWGHVHQALAFGRGGVTGLAGPSSVSNSLPHSERFSRDPAGPACRWVRLAQDGTFAAGVLRPEP